MQLLRPDMNIHLVGIGGFGLSAIARVLNEQGYHVSGSDRQPTAMTEALLAEGIAVAIGHDRGNVTNLAEAQSPASTLIVASSAIPEDNVEIMEARELGIPVVKRRQLLGDLTRGKITIAISGTHGKTTTAAMASWILLQAGLDPTFIVGGVMQNLGSNARAGRGLHFVIEADEYDRAFLGLWPDIAVVTTLEHDHPDCFPTLDDMRNAFLEFADHTVDGGRVLICDDDEGARWLGKRLAAAPGSRQTITYGLRSDCHWQAEDLNLKGSPTFKVRRGGKCLGTCAIQLPGRHNVLNALAALAVAGEVGVEFGAAAAALTRFQGTERRFELKGQAMGIAVVDDYAHHPTEIRATLQAARGRYPGQPIWAVFQPHTYSRTAALLDEFAASFDDADHVLVTGIFAARERNISGVSATDLADQIRAHKRARSGEANRCLVEHVDSLDSAVALLLGRVQAGDLVLTLGAGDGYLVGDQLLNVLRQRESQMLGGQAEARNQSMCGSGPDLVTQERW